MQRYICIHGHFSQPPRENPWLEAVELQDSAYPYHDWNERVTAECYAPNAVARILDGEGRIARIVNNYARISFDFGPTLLAWLADKMPDVYRAILAADRESQAHFGGHGSALAQVYNHVIMPLATRRDKETQVRWGQRDFELRFGRLPEGMWLPETAVDLETLDVLAELGLRFTILAPHQAAAVRKLKGRHWEDVSGARIDPSVAYELHLPSKRRLVVFFYDGPISQAVTFEGLLSAGERLAQRLASGFSDQRHGPQLVHVASDGEVYGHHHRYGEMALAYALDHIQSHDLARLTNYGEYLALHPPRAEVRIHEHTSWSCVHGVERWRSDCGCHAGRAGGDQAWRGPLRAALDWLRDTLIPLFEQQAGQLLTDPWAARNDYIDVILDRSPESVQRFLARHASRTLDEAEQITVLKLLELQRHALLMYTSCGWFFDDLSGPETVQILQYAGRAVQVGEELFGVALEAPLLDRLAQARSNVAEHRDGRHIYEQWVKPTMLDWRRIAAHYAISSLFESYPDRSRLFCYTVQREDGRSREVGQAKLVAGRARFTSDITREARTLMYGAIHFGDHNVNGGVAPLVDDQTYGALADELTAAFLAADFPAVIRVMDRGFGEANYSLRSLFRDEQRRVVQRILRPTLAEALTAYRQLYERHLPTMRFLTELGIPLPGALRAAADCFLNADLRWEGEAEGDEPDLERAQTLMQQAQWCHVPLDPGGFGYRLKRTLQRLAEKLAADPGNCGLVAKLARGVELASALPFELDLWLPQNVFHRLLQTVAAEFVQRLERGDPEAERWLEHFLGLGEKLGVQVGELKKKVTAIQQAPRVPVLVREVFAQRRVPDATYRLQFTPQFTFAAAQALLPYLAQLGISDCYASPIWRPRRNSAHGYDVCDHAQLNPALGSEQDFAAFTAALREQGLGLLLDTVPNHMGIGDAANVWWMDVLENGPGSVYAGYFDIDWHPVNPDLENKVLLPVLEDQYGAVLESGKIRLAYEEGAFFLYYYDLKLPVAPRTYPPILSYRLEPLAAALGPEHEHVQELRSILTALSYLPERTALAPEKIAERNREKQVIKGRIATLAHASEPVGAAIEDAVRAFNGTVGEPASFDLLDRLLEAQAYRLAFWRVAMEEVNYRRFFDVNELAAICMENPEVFEATHRRLLTLLADGQATGLRIDHPDGLRNPREYLQRLQEKYVLAAVRARLPAERPAAEVEQEVTAALAALGNQPPPAPRVWPLYVVAEKILCEGETLPEEWAVDGTTGYDFLNAVNGLFVDPRQEDAFTRLYAEFTGSLSDFRQLTAATKKMIMLVSMASEINALSHRVERLAERNRRYRDFTLNSMTFVIREIIACLAVYRTYLTGPESVTPQDRTVVEAAVARAKKLNPRTPASIFDFVQDTLLLRNLPAFREEDRPAVIAWVLTFQQLTGPIMAKGVEDTAFYVYHRLASLNEVGGHPEQFGVPLAAFHQQNVERRRRWPNSMLTTATHDTKRGEDVRARLNVLAEMPDEWRAAINRWSARNAAKKVLVDGAPCPDRNDEYLLYQTLVGAWPAQPLSAEDFRHFRTRIADYLHKATKEAKVHTSWVNPNEAYDTALREFVHRLLPDAQEEDPFLSEFLPFQARVAQWGHFNSLAQLVLKMTSPGMPDFYQGTELWDLHLVDPDNRQSVDYATRIRCLDEIRQRENDLATLLADLCANWADGRIKMYLTYRSLNYRRRHRPVFTAGAYLPLEASGARQEHVCAFLRHGPSGTVLVAVPRLVRGLAGEGRTVCGAEVWQNTALILPGEAPREWRNVLTGEIVTAPAPDPGPRQLPMAAVLQAFPVALLEGLPAPAAGSQDS